MESAKDKIIQTASRLFHKSGVRNVTIDEVCADLRISKKTLYIHFKNKEELISAVIDDIKRLNYDRVEKNLMHKNAIDSLIFIIKELKKNIDCEPHQLWFDVQKYYPKVFEMHDKQQMELIRIGFEQNLRQGIEEGYYRKDLDIEMVTFFHSIHIRNTFELMQENVRKFSKKRMMDFYIDLILHLIANEEGMRYLGAKYYSSEKR